MAARPDNVEMGELKDRVVDALIDEKKKPVLTNYVAIQKLTANFATYIESTGISVPAMLLEQLKGDDAGAKIAFIKANLCPRVNGLEGLVIDACHSEGVELSREKIDKCVRYMRAMAEVADA